MSGPVAIEYVLVSALLEGAWTLYQEWQARRAGEAARQQEVAAQRMRDRHAANLRREEERRAREETKRRIEKTGELMVKARSHEQRLEHVRALAEEARTRFPEVALEIPATPAAPVARDDPAAVERYIATLEGAIHQVEARIRDQSMRAATQEGLKALMGAIESAVDTEPRTAADLLTLYANEVRTLARPAAPNAMDRHATAERILGRLAGIEAGEVPEALDALMRQLVEAETDDRAEMLALELRAKVQQFNEARERAAAAAAENRKREIAGVLVAEVLSDLGYEVEPIAETLFVSGGVAHFQRAEWGDYYVRMRVDPATSNVNFNMVRATTDTGPPDAVQRKRDEEMEAAWCTGIPKLLAELAARGIDTRKLRELDAGAVPVQAVMPDTIDAILRQKDDERIAARPREMARPIKGG